MAGPRNARPFAFELHHAAASSPLPCGERSARELSRGRNPLTPTLSPRGRGSSPCRGGNASINEISLAPELAAGDVGALADRGELGPDHVGADHLAAGRGAEAAVGSGNDTAAVADRLHGLQQ